MFQNVQANLMSAWKRKIDNSRMIKGALFVPDDAQFWAFHKRELFFRKGVVDPFYTKARKMGIIAFANFRD